MKTQATITVTYHGYVCRTCNRRMDIGDTMVMPEASDHWHCVDCAFPVAPDHQQEAWEHENGLLHPAVSACVARY